ncbi:hypothetical protein ACIQVK_19660 [Streptomyces sp. NPDC090493]|uniref:hypothetical protein n=1 Tax=Streptomyces sp. NPDC090493 TaxID=3365964 RepID=UPI0038298C2C
MTTTPFRDTATTIAERMDYVAMQVGCDKARSHTWWRNVVEHGPWKGQQGRTAPPTPDEWAGIAKLFGTTEDQVCAMIAADWFGVQPGDAVSARVLQLAPLLDGLTDTEAEAVGVVIRSMRSPVVPSPPRRVVRLPKKPD